MVIDWPTGQWLIGLAVTLVATLVPAGIAIWRGAIWVSSEFKNRDDAIDKAGRDASLAVQAADARARMAEDLLRTELADHKLYIAEHYATEDGVSKALEPVLKALDRMSDRLDQIIANGAPRPTPRTRG